MFSAWQDKHTIPPDPYLPPTAAHQQHFLGGTEAELALTWSDLNASYSDDVHSLQQLGFKAQI